MLSKPLPENCTLRFGTEIKDSRSLVKNRTLERLSCRTVGMKMMRVILQMMRMILQMMTTGVQEVKL